MDTAVRRRELVNSRRPAIRRTGPHRSRGVDAPNDAGEEIAVREPTRSFCAICRLLMSWTELLPRLTRSSTLWVREGRLLAGSDFSDDTGQALVLQGDR
jgi:hypothetical protein